MENHKYIVANHRGRDCSWWFTVHETPEEANTAARLAWERLTAYDKKGGRRIHAAIVYREDIPEYAIDEDTGVIDWTQAEYYIFPGAWDSDEL